MEGDRGWVHGDQDPEVGLAERALHARASLACRAAAAAGVAGRFQAWEQGGVLAVLATDPALAFLSTISGVTPRTLSAALDLICDTVWAGVTPALTSPVTSGGRVESGLRSAGLIQGPDRALAVRRLDMTGEAEPHASVVDAADDQEFISVLLAGYEADGPVAGYIRAEHGHRDVRRFLAVDDGALVAAAAMTVHGRVAVLGGASTLPMHRRRGAQSHLIEYRVRRATEAGCTLAAASVRPGSVSEANLQRAGFHVHRCLTWTKPAAAARADGTPPT